MKATGSQHLADALRNNK
ncbi:unnamed protein product, partial [Rotaria sp. Silwood2]